MFTAVTNKCAKSVSDAKILSEKEVPGTDLCAGVSVCCVPCGAAVAVLIKVYQAIRYHSTRTRASIYMYNTLRGVRLRSPVAPTAVGCACAVEVVHGGRWRGAPLHRTQKTLPRYQIIAMHRSAQPVECSGPILGTTSLYSESLCRQRDCLATSGLLQVAHRLA